MILSMLENGTLKRVSCDSVSFDHCCNVLCVGAGSAGIYAADAAASEGAKVILCDIDENIGGMPVMGNVTGYYYGACGGSYEEDDEKSKGDTVFIKNLRQPEQRQIHLTERLKNSGASLLCRHSALGLYFENDRVVGILAFDGTQKVSIKADITIDATSDGHLIRMTDVPKRYGRPVDQSFVPFGVYLQYTQNAKLFSKNNDSGIMDHYNCAEFSKKTVMAHANADSFIKGKEFLSCAPHTGVREGLTFEGEDCVRYEDLLLGKQPPKTLFWAYSDLDRHGSLRATEEELFQNWWVIANLATVTISIPVPMGSVVPKNIKGLVTAGRCLSSDTYSQSAVRMNRDMFRMGECVGVAAAMASIGGVDFLDIDYNEFLSKVKNRGCFEGCSSRRFSFDNSYKAYLDKMRSLGRQPDPKYEGLSLGDFIYEPIEFDVDKSFEKLKTDAPGVAIWSCFISTEKEDVKNRLFRELSDTDNRQYKYNCAIALGLLGDVRALDTLKDIVKNRDCFYFTDNRRSNQFRSAVAVCLIGRLGSEKELPLLLEILSPDEFERDMYHTLEANYLYHAEPDRNFVYFAMLSHACMAICNVYRRCGLDTKKLHELFAEIFKDGTYLRRVTSATKGKSAHEEMTGFIEYLLNITK